MHYILPNHQYPPTTPERRACETPLQAPKQAASQPASKARQQGSQAARQPGSQAARQSSPPGTQAAGIQDLGARMLRSYHLIILSSSIGDLLARNRLPQAATGRPTFWPQNMANLINRCSRLHRSAKWLSWVPCLSQLSPNAPTSLQGPSQVTPQVNQGTQNASQIGAKSVTRHTKRQSSKYLSIQASGPRGRRQKR